MALSSFVTARPIFKAAVPRVNVPVPTAVLVYRPSVPLLSSVPPVYVLAPIKDNSPVPALMSDKGEAPSLITPCTMPTPSCCKVSAPAPCTALARKLPADCSVKAAMALRPALK